MALVALRNLGLMYHTQRLTPPSPRPIMRVMRITAVIESSPLDDTQVSPYESGAHSVKRYSVPESSV